MVKLQKLVLKNFKSFKKAEIPISDGFTVIAGSNGSGKTNILDGLMFVLGATSLKSLRAGRLTDLVNNTAVENYAKAELLLKQDGRAVEISRIIDKQGKSVYRMNEERKTMNEITSYLSELGIKADGHNIVVQGDITRIVTMSPIERREIIDAVAGLQEFDLKKEEALKELEKVSTRVKEAGIVLKERENYLLELEKEKMAAEEFEKLEEERKRSKASILFLELEHVRKEMQEKKEKLAGIGAEKKALLETIEEKQKEINELKQRSAELNAVLIASSEKTYSTIGARLEEKKAEKRIAEEMMLMQQNSLQRNNERIASLKAKSDTAKKEAVTAKQKLSETEKRLLQLPSEISEIEKQKKEAEGRQENFEKEMRKLQARMDEISESFSSAQERVFAQQSEIAIAEKEKKFLEKEISDYSEEMEKNRAALRELEKKQELLNALAAKIPNPKEKKQELLENAEKNLVLLKEIEAKISELKENSDALKKETAFCPVCEEKLEKKKRESLLEKRVSAIKHLEMEQRKLAEKRNSVLAQLRETEIVLEKTTDLKNEIALLQQATEKHNETEKRFKKARQATESLDVQEMARQKAKLDQELLVLRQKRMEQEQKIKETRAFEGMQKFKTVSLKLAELERQKDVLETEKKHLHEKINETARKEIEETDHETKELEKENAQKQEEIKARETSMKKTSSEISELEKELKKAEQESQRKAEEKERIEEKTSRAIEAIAAKSQKARSLEDRQNQLNVEVGKEEVRIYDLEEENKQFEGVQVFREASKETLTKRILEIEKRVKELGAINMRAVAAFEELRSEVEEVRKKVEKLEQERIAVLEMIDKIEVKRTNVFLECFNEVNRNFAKMFFALFSGEGQLSLSSPEKPLESGLIIEAKHKGENLKSIDAMSGGEKSLTALAFLFGIQLYEPAPFYVFDEADAALDRENSAKLVNLIKEVSKQSQFIAITHNEQLIQEADQIIGVALNKQKSSVIGLKLTEEIHATAEE